MFWKTNPYFPSSCFSTLLSTREPFSKFSHLLADVPHLANKVSSTTVVEHFLSSLLMLEKFCRLWISKEKTAESPLRAPVQMAEPEREQACHVHPSPPGCLPGRKMPRWDIRGTDSTLGTSWITSDWKSEEWNTFYKVQAPPPQQHRNGVHTMHTGKQKTEQLVFSPPKFKMTIYQPLSEMRDCAKKGPQGISATDLAQRIAETTAQGTQLLSSKE